MKGPWCDVWSIGCSLIHLICCHSSADEKKKVSVFDIAPAMSDNKGKCMP